LSKKIIEEQFSAIFSNQYFVNYCENCKMVENFSTSINLLYLPKYLAILLGHPVCYAEISRAYWMLARVVCCGIVCIRSVRYATSTNGFFICHSYPLTSSSRIIEATVSVRCRGTIQHHRIEVKETWQYFMPRLAPRYYNCIL